MKKVKFEKVSRVLTKEEMNSLMGGAQCYEKTDVRQDTEFKEGTKSIYQSDVVGSKQDAIAGKTDCSIVASGNGLAG